MSCEVTEPKRRPSSPAWWAIVSGGLRERALARLLALGRGRDRALGGGLRDLARDQVVAQVALGDVDDRPAGAELLMVLQEDRLRHG